MSAPSTPTFALNWLNIFYRDLDRIHAASIPASPLASKLKYEKTGGESVASPFTLAGHRGEAGTFTAAQTVASQSQARASTKYRWIVPYGTYVGSVQIEHRDIALSRQDKDAAARALQYDMDLAFKQRMSNLMRLFLGPRGSNIDTFATASTNTGVLTASTRTNAARVQVGDLVSISTADGTSGALTGDPGYVIAVDVEAGTVTVSATSFGSAGFPSGWSTSTTYYLFRYGEWNSSDPQAMLTKLQDYLPATVASTDLHNVKRSQSSLLSGNRMPDSELGGRSLVSKIKRFISNAREVAGIDGAEIDTVVLNPIDWQTAEEELNVQMSREVTTKGADGFSRIMISTANGETELMSEPHCPRGVMFFLATSQLVWHTPTGTSCMWADEEGRPIRRKETELVYEGVPVTYLATVLRAPYAHGRASTTV